MLLFSKGGYSKRIEDEIAYCQQKSRSYATKYMPLLTLSVNVRKIQKYRQKNPKMSQNMILFSK